MIDDGESATSPMISQQNTERTKKKVHTFVIAYLLIVEILPIYRKWFMNPSSFFSGNNLFLFGTKYLIPYQKLILPYQGLIFREVRDLGTRKFVDKYILRVSRLYLFVHNKLSISGRIVEWGTWNSRRIVLRVASERTPQLS